jgi:transcription initiation factor TFIIB
MVFSYSKSKKGEKLVFNMSFDPDSTFSSTLLNGDFSELVLRDDGIQITVPEEKLASKQVGVRVDGVYQILSLEPAIKTETRSIPLPPEKSSIEEMENRLSSQGILETSVERTVEKMEKSSTEEKAHAQYCPDCGSKNIIHDYDTSETVCSECGIVLPEKTFDHGPEWRAFDDEQRRQRTRAGAPVTYTVHDKGLSTMIDWHDRDAYGKGFSPRQKAQYYRLRKWQKRIRVSDATERNLAFALNDITRLSNKLNLPKSILETASVNYRKAVKERLVRGRSIAGVTAASTYLACRQCGIPRTLQEVSDASGVNKKELSRSYRFLIKEFDYTVQQIEKSKLVSKYANRLNGQGKIEEIANKTLTTAKNLRLTSGKGPQGIAAAATYIASILVGERKTQRELAEYAEVTEVTIRNRYKALVNNLMFDMTL